MSVDAGGQSKRGRRADSFTKPKTTPGFPKPNWPRESEPSTPTTPKLPRWKLNDTYVWQRSKPNSPYSTPWRIRVTSLQRGLVAKNKSQRPTAQAQLSANGRKCPCHATRQSNSVNLFPSIRQPRDLHSPTWVGQAFRRRLEVNSFYELQILRC